MENTGEKAAFSIRGACHYLNCSRPTLYRLMDMSAIPSFHILKRRLILKEHLDRFLRERLEAEGANR